MAEIQEPRRAKVNIAYRRKSKVKRTVSTMAQYEEGFTYTDASDGECDEASLTVCNRDMRWFNKWLPKKGDKMSATIKLENWTAAGVTKSVNCGKFCVDDISFSGPGLTCTIKGTSVPETNSMRATSRSKNWKSITLKEIGRRIAKRYKMVFRYYGPVVKIKTAEQSKQDDLNFLSSICKDYGYALKVYSGKLVIYSISTFEAKKTVATYTLKDFEDWDYNSTLTGTYTGGKVTYTSGSSNKELTCKVGSGKRILTVNSKVDSLADARKKAVAAVNAENRSAVTMNMTMLANPKIRSGVNIRIKGAYKLNGKYFVDKVTYSLSGDSGCKMSVETHKVMPKITASATK